MPFPIVPLIGSLIGAGGSIMSGILGGNAQDKANEINWAINMYNSRKRDTERREGMQYAEKLRDESKLGSTDPLGNRTFFEEGEGWKSELGHIPQQLLDYYLSQELPEMRSQFEREAATNRSESDIAGQLLQQFQRVMREDPQAIEDILYSISTRGISEGMSEAMGPAMLNALRTGQPGQAGDITAKLGREAMNARREAAQDAKIQSLDYVDQKYNQERSNLSQLYNLFAQRAGEDLQPSAQPGFGIENAIPTMAQLGARNDAAGLQATMKQGGTLGDVEPMLGASTAWGAAGNALAGLGDRIGSMQERGSMNDLLKQYITQGGQLDLGRGGIMDLMTERVRGNMGDW